MEFSIVAIPILLLGTGSIELAQWFFNKQAVSLALLQAGRAGITTHANPASIENAFEEALLPLFPATPMLSARQRLQQALNQRSQTTNAAPWRIEILSPTPGAFLDFSDSSLAISHQTGLPAINNNYLAEQDQRKRALGWAHGLGPQSGQSILQANGLVLRLTYLHEPVLPGMKSLMRLLGGTGGTYARHAMARGGYLPLVQDIALVMQSHPVNWPLPENGKIVMPQSTSKNFSWAPLASPCQGLWCQGQQPASGTPGVNFPDHKPLPYWPPGHEQPGQASGPPTIKGGTDSVPSSGDLVVTPDDPACGVALCCA
ncbi:pilus assembly protein [Alcaligenaceae bacterium]|nr:pilus assembly protein [Alcaligenaceae bacterium]